MAVDLELSSSQYIDFGNNLNREYTDAFSLMGWINLESSPSGGNFETCTKIAPATGNGYGYRIKNNAATGNVNRLAFFLQGTGGGFLECFSSSTNLSTGTWYHIATTYSGSGTVAGVKFYIDAVLQTSNIVDDNIASTIANTGTFKLGAYGSTSPTNFFDGKMARFSFWNKELTAAEIQSDMNRRIPFNETSIGAMWDMDESSGTNVNDLSGTIDGTTQNSPAWADGPPVTNGL